MVLDYFAGAFLLLARPIYCSGSFFVCIIDTIITGITTANILLPDLVSRGLLVRLAGKSSLTKGPERATVS